MKRKGLEFYVGWWKRRRTIRASDQPRVKSRTVIECSMRFSTRAIHAGQDPDPVTGSVTVPVYLTSTYQQPGPGKEGKYVYSRTYRLFDQVLRKYGIQFTYVNPENPESVEKAIRKNTRLIWIETPTNPLMRIVDIRQF